MKNPLYFLYAGFILAAQACADVVPPPDVRSFMDTDTINRGCYLSYEMTDCENGDTINKQYGRNKIKQGRWIEYGFGLKDYSGEKVIPIGAGQLMRVKLEEGYYRNNKKVGVWKYYNSDGSIRDSVDYKDGKS